MVSSETSVKTSPKLAVNRCYDRGFCSLKIPYWSPSTDTKIGVCAIIDGAIIGDWGHIVFTVTKKDYGPLTK